MKHKVDIAITALGFVPGLGVAAWVYRAYRVVRIARAARAAGFLNFHMKVSRPVAHLAGRMCTRGGRYGPRARNGARHRTSGDFHYRPRREGVGHNLPDPTLVLFLLSVPCLAYAGWNRDCISPRLFVLLIVSFIFFAVTATMANHVVGAVGAAMLLVTAGTACYQIATRRPPRE